MDKYGLIGYPLKHSFSEKFFRSKFQKEQIKEVDYGTYELFSVDGFRKFMLDNNLLGCNVTIPHKVSVIQHLDALDKTAADVGAVNCILRQVTDNQTISYKGFNTDVFGFEQSVQKLLPADCKALLLGNGGAAMAIKYVFKKRAIPYQIVTRKQDNHLNYEDVDGTILSDYQLLINTTPLGTYPNIDTCPAIDYTALSPEHVLYDLVYNPEETLFLKEGKRRDCTIKNGYEMLVLQAEESWRIWRSLPQNIM